MPTQVQVHRQPAHIRCHQHLQCPRCVEAALVIAKASGLISGSFTHPDTTKPTYQGVIMQKGPLKGAHGYFMTTTPKVLTYLGESGKVSVLAK